VKNGCHGAHFLTNLINHGVINQRCVRISCIGPLFDFPGIACAQVIGKAAVFGDFFQHLFFTVLAGITHFNDIPNRKGAAPSRCHRSVSAGNVIGIDHPSFFMGRNGNPAANMADDEI